MAIEMILQMAFRGCGLDLESVRRSGRYARVLMQLSSVAQRYSATTSLGALLRVGPQTVGQLLCSWPLAETIRRVRARELENWQFDARLMTEVLLLGGALQRRAYRCLPRSYSYRSCPEHRFRRLQLPLTPAQLVKSWQTGDRETRLEVARALTATLNPPKEVGYSYRADRACQPIARVLPAFFSTWNGKDQWEYEAARKPNCIGKALLAASFGLHAGARILVVIPATEATTVHSQYRAKIAQISLSELRGSGVPLLRSRRQGLKQMVRHGKNKEEEISWQHAAVAMEIASDEWVLIDPNMGMTSIFTREWGIDRAYEELCFCYPVLPGLSVFRRIPGGSAGQEAFLDLTRINCASLREFAESGCFDKLLGKEEIVDRLVQSKLLDRLFCWKEYGPDKFSSTATRRRKAIAILLDMAVTCKCLQGRPGLLSYADREDVDRWLIGQLTNEEMRRALQKLAYQFATRGITLMDREHDRMQDSGELMHPEIQISNPNFALATAVLSHVAKDYGVEVAQLVASKLNSLGLDLFRLHESAGTLLTNSRIAGNDARKSASILMNGLPFRLASSDRIVGALREMGIEH